VEIDGYRKGKAPPAVVVKALGGEERVAATAVAELVEAAAGEALAGCVAAATALEGSEALEGDIDEMAKGFSVTAPFTFALLFDAQPTVSWKIPYREVAVTVEAASSDAAAAAEAERMLAAVRKETGAMRVAVGRGLAHGDVAVIDFDAARADTGEPIPGAKRDGMKMDTEIADAEWIPGVAAAMAGMTVGEARRVELTFPTDEDFSPASLRGVAATVDVVLKELFEWDLPEVDDAWAAKVMGDESATAADVRARLLENAVAAGEQATARRVADALQDAVAAAVAAEVPPSLVQEAGRNAYSQELAAAMRRGALDYAQVEQLSAPQLVAAYVKSKYEELETMQRAALGFADILEKEAVRPDPAAVEAEYAAALQDALTTARGDQVNEEGLREGVVRALESRAVVDWLAANCRVAVEPHRGEGGEGGGAAAAKAPRAKKAAAAAGEAKPKRAAAKPKAAAGEGGEAPKRRGRPKKDAAAA
jgi:trigger factor